MKPILSVRGLMALVLLSGVALHLSAAAWRAYWSNTPHLHSAIILVGTSPGKATLVQKEPFWSALLRETTGIGKTGCFKDKETMLEMCELAHPEIRLPTAPNTYAPIFTPEQLQLVERLNQAQAEKRPKKDGWEWFRKLVRK